MNKEEFIEKVGVLFDMVRPMPSIVPLVQIVKIGQRIAQRHLSGQAGAAMDKDAQLYLDLMGDLPDELRMLL